MPADVTSPEVGHFESDVNSTFRMIVLDLLNRL